MFVSWETELCLIQTIGRGERVMAGDGGIDRAANRSLRGGIRRGDFDFLEADDVRERPALEAGAEGRLG